MRIGVFGGSFDPVHLAHLQLADYCWREARLDRVLFVPAAQQPHKPRGLVASDAHRVAMLRLATADRPEFEVSTIEIDRGGVSYTAQTLFELSADALTDDFFFLMGADSLADFPNWREPEVICRMATPLVVRRPGSPEPDFDALQPFVPPERLAEFRAVQIEMPETPISSSEIRRLVADGGPWRQMVPPAVADYIEEQGLYRAPRR